MLTREDIIAFCDKHNYDIRLSGNGRWIDQKCTPDVVWSISDFVIEYVENVGYSFTARDIWESDYAKETIADTFSKPGTDDINAVHEYDKVFSQPLNMLSYAGVIEDIGSKNRHRYIIKDKNVLEFIARNDLNALRFLQIYVEKVLNDSGLMSSFDSFFTYQDSIHFNNLKKHFISFYHMYTPIKKEYEPKRIFTKVLNPLAYKYSKKGTEHGHISRDIITRSDLMYNRDNFRDIYYDKPKGVARGAWEKNHVNLDVRKGYFMQEMNASKRTLRNYIAEYKNNTSELTLYNTNHSDDSTPTQIHHIFPKNEFPTIMYFIENLIALTPNQHFEFAHPKNNTFIVDLEAQRELLIAKTYSIKNNIENPNEVTIYSFSDFLYVLGQGWADERVESIPNGDYSEVIHAIDLHYKHSDTANGDRQLSFFKANDY